MFPKKGNVFPRRGGRDKSPAEYANVVAAALRSELGDTHRAVKIVRRWTGASERTVKNWLAGAKGPSGGYLLLLINKSNAVLQALLVAAGRAAVLAVNGVSALAEGNDGASERIRAMGTRRRKGSASAFDQDGYHPPDHGDDPENVPKNVPDDDPINDPINDPENAVDILGLNDRQRWILHRLAQRRRIGPAEVRWRFGVSEKTAKRDIAGLKMRGLIRFVGSLRKGIYELAVR